MPFPLLKAVQVASHHPAMPPQDSPLVDAPRRCPSSVCLRGCKVGDAHHPLSSRQAGPGWPSPTSAPLPTTAVPVVLVPADQLHDAHRLRALPQHHRDAHRTRGVKTTTYAMLINKRTSTSLMEPTQQHLGRLPLDRRLTCR